MPWVVVDRYVQDGYSYRLMRRPVRAAWPGLSKREWQVLELVADGCTNKEIAQRLEVSPSTVGVLIFRATGKLSARAA